MLGTPDHRATALPFWPLLGLLLALAVGHTLWATSLDSFTIDEPYHIAAGASYLRYGDFRVNPEHPPLVKLVVALAEPASILHLTPPGIVDDKYQERVYTQTAVFLNSDSYAVQRRSRTALIILNTLLLGALTFLLRRVFSPAIALATLLLLALDPTVSAHMPVVMTDLPMALLGTICCALAVLALRCRRWRDWLLFGLGCGLLLATKHSAPLIVLPLTTGCAATLIWQKLREHRADSLQQLARLTVAVLLAVAVLWSAYGFRFHESRARDAQGHYIETFNRPLDAKIADLHSPLLRHSLTFATRAHLVPRAYIWGLADTLRAGVEGRPSLVVAFGHEFFGKPPAWVAFAFLLVKLPLGFLFLATAGLALLTSRKLDPPTARPLTVFIAMLIFFMAFIAKNGVFYAGLRHWLFSVPLLAIAAATFVVFCLHDQRSLVRLIPVIAVLSIAVTVLPQRRIWEYHNIIAGGSANAWRAFLNESVDLGQRSHEIIAFAKAHISPEEPLYGYGTMREELQANGIKRREPKPDEVANGYISGWQIVEGPGLPVKNWKGVEALRDIQPTARFGNAFLYHGTFYMPIVAAGILQGEAMHQLHLKNGDRTLAEDYMHRAVKMAPDDASTSWRELGNFALGRRDNAEALRCYRLAIHAEKDDASVRNLIQQQINLVERSPAGTVPAMPDPYRE